MCNGVWLSRMRYIWELSSNLNSLRSCGSICLCQAIPSSHLHMVEGAHQNHVRQFKATQDKQT